MISDGLIIAADPEMRAIFFQAHSEKLFIKLAESKERVARLEDVLGELLKVAQRHPDNDLSAAVLIRVIGVLGDGV